MNSGWLEPLLAPIYQDSHTVSVPIMDIIDADTFYYSASDLVKGGFNWGMHYQWEPLTPVLAKKIFEKPDPYEYVCLVIYNYNIIYKLFKQNNQFCSTNNYFLFLKTIGNFFLVLQQWLGVCLP